MLPLKVNVPAFSVVSKPALKLPEPDVIPFAVLSVMMYVDSSKFLFTAAGLAVVQVLPAKEMLTMEPAFPVTTAVPLVGSHSPTTVPF